MFFNIASLILIYSFFLTIIFSAGKIGNLYIFKFKNLGFGEFGILGFIIVYFIVLVVHFFSSINDYFIYFTYQIFLFVIGSILGKYKFVKWFVVKMNKRIFFSTKNE